MNTVLTEPGQTVYDASIHGNRSLLKSSDLDAGRVTILALGDVTSPLKIMVYVTQCRLVDHYRSLARTSTTIKWNSRPSQIKSRKKKRRNKEDGFVCHRYH
jgi:hypothetical protein